MKRHDKLLIVGAGGHGKVVAEIAELKKNYTEIVFLDDDENISICLGLRVIGKTTEMLMYVGDYDIFVGIGNPTIRKMFIDILSTNRALIPTLIHPSAVVSKHSKVGIGTVIMANAVINADSSIGKGVIVNTGATVDHDNQIGDYVHIAVGSHLAGKVSVGEGTFLGAGSIVKNNVSICENVTIGAGGVVVQDIDNPGIYVGVPVRKKKDMDNNKWKRYLKF